LKRYWYPEFVPFWHRPGLREPPRLKDSVRVIRILERDWLLELLGAIADVISVGEFIGKNLGPQEISRQSGTPAQSPGGSTGILEEQGPQADVIELYDSSGRVRRLEIQDPRVRRIDVRR
jgi:hypothetical protein